MSKEKNSNKKKSKDSITKLNIFGKMIAIIVLVWLASVSYFACVFFAVAMLPSIVSKMIDRGVGKFASKTVTACNFIATIPYLVDIGLAYEKDLLAKELMLSMETWVVIYGIASVGWMMIWFVPNLTSSFYALQARYRIEKLNEEIEALVEEWGEEVKFRYKLVDNNTSAKDSKKHKI